MFDESIEISGEERKRLVENIRWTDHLTAENESWMMMDRAKRWNSKEACRPAAGSVPGRRVQGKKLAFLAFWYVQSADKRASEALNGGVRCPLSCSRARMFNIKKKSNENTGKYEATSGSLVAFSLTGALFFQI